MMAVASSCSALLGLILLCAPATAMSTPLDDYVNKPDASFSYHHIEGAQQKGPGFTIEFLNMTSQTWLDASDFESPVGHVWWHYLAVIIPDKIIITDKAVLYITGGDNKQGQTPPQLQGDDELEVASLLAVSLHCVAAVLYQVPNQPIVFTDDVLRHSRSEDAAIAFTWDHYFRHPGSPEWLLRMPMTKAAVRAMDAVSGYVHDTKSSSISDWAVAGASKRGWTTWMVAAVDKRVKCIVPIVLDALNLRANFHHWWRALGGWTFAIKDYHDLNFTARIDDNITQQMFDIIDPIAYTDRYATIPKLVINAGGDEFLMADDSFYWFNAMQGETHLLMVQDADHSMSTGLEQLVPSFITFVKSVFTGIPRPTMTWVFGPHPKGIEGSSITVTTSVKPHKVLVWHADTKSTTRRDFRLATLQSPCPTKTVHTPGGTACFQPIPWLPSNATKLSDTSYQAAFSPPVVGGWKAYFLVAEFDVPGSKLRFKVTTQVSITPQTLPFKDCVGAQCLGVLV